MIAGAALNGIMPFCSLASFAHRQKHKKGRTAAFNSDGLPATLGTKRAVLSFVHESVPAGAVCTIHTTRNWLETHSSSALYSILCQQQLHH
eukprot:964167-Pelagomonas_calceolata.AAC.2